MFLKESEGKYYSVKNLVDESLSNIHSKVEINSEKVEKTINLILKPQGDWKVDTLRGRKTLQSIVLVLELWAEERNAPLSSIKEYKDGDKVLMQVAEFKHVLGGRKASIGLNRNPDTDEQVISFRFLGN